MSEVYRYLLGFAPEVISSIVTVIFGVVAIVIKQMVARMLDTDTKKSLANIAVRYVEQVFREIHGEEKMLEAINVFREMLFDRGIEISNQEMRVILEAAVNEFNQKVN